MILQEIEENFPVDQIRSKGRSVWTLLRVPLMYEFRSRIVGDSVSLIGTNWWVLFTQSLRGFPWLFRRCDILLSTDEREARFFDKDLECKLFHFIYKALPKHSLHTLELPLGINPWHFRRTDPCLISLLPIYIVARFIEFFIRTPSIEDDSLIQKIWQRYRLKTNVSKHLKRHETYRLLATIILKIKRPKMIILSWYYSKFQMAMIESAHQLNIQVIEIQHGVISKQHGAYNSYGAKLNSSFLPDELWTYGSQEQKECNIVSSDKIICMGHPYLSYILKKKVSDKKNHPRIRVGITLQYINENYILDFIREVSGLMKDVDFQLIPRDRSNLGRFQALPSNVRVVSDRDFYAKLEDIDVHCTGSSSCAVEALAAGIPNIFINSDGIASKYFGSILGDEQSCYYVVTPKEFEVALRKAIQRKGVQVAKSVAKLMNTQFESSFESYQKSNPNWLRLLQETRGVLQ